MKLFSFFAGFSMSYGVHCLSNYLANDKNVFANKKFQLYLLIISYIIFYFYHLGNEKKLISGDILNSIAFNEIIIFYKVIITTHSIYFSYLLTSVLPYKWQNITNKIIVFLFFIFLILVGYFIVEILAFSGKY